MGAARPLSLAILLCVPGVAVAAPSSHVAWTVEVVNLIRGGNADSGRQSSQACAACHGTAGVSPDPVYPHLAGQDAAYTYKQLRDYRDGTRTNALMRAFVSTLSDEEMADIAAFYAAQPSPRGAAAEGGKASVAAQGLIARGDGTRLIPACSSCHGSRGQGDPRSYGMPALAGQTAAYLRQTMQAYRSGARANDVYSVMRSVSKRLTDEEIDAIATYYATRDVKRR